MEIFMWRKNWKRQMTESMITKNVKKFLALGYGTVLTSFTDTEGLKSHDKINNDQDVVELMKMIRNLCCKHGFLFKQFTLSISKTKHDQ